MKNHMQSACCWRICHICLQIRGRRRKHKIYGEILQTAAIIHWNSQIRKWGGRNERVNVNWRNKNINKKFILVISIKIMLAKNRKAKGCWNHRSIISIASLSIFFENKNLRQTFVFKSLNLRSNQESNHPRYFQSIGFFAALQSNHFSFISNTLQSKE